ncbi:MAG: SUF system NifU family Fe-S cluster assembly protein [Candidatus Omnitrophica bacterium]|nr:SUF system NifU family Fe-S cluster assembly protein [Candidatus Omnitrophota bacterium]
MTIHNDELYQQVILEHNKRPKNFVKLEVCTHQAEGYNPLCGDHLNVYLNVSPAGIIDEVTFQGDGCAISKASASMMTAAIKGKTVDEARHLFEEFHHLLTKELDPATQTNHLGKLTVFSGIWKYPSRVKCAVLAWRTMKGALDQEKSVATE